MLTQNGATTETGHPYEAVKVRLTPIEWLICAVACLGFVFDIYESLMLPLIVRPAITSLGQLRPGTASFNLWVGLLFYIPNLVGGMFGLLGGYLADLFGRRRMLFWSFLGTMLFNGLHSFWGNYLPRMYPTHLRATGESFAANIGGRAIGVSAALATTTLSNVMPGANPSASLAHSAGTIAVLVLITALSASFALPEPAGDRLPD